MDANRRPGERHARPEMASRRNMFSRASCRRCGLSAVLISVFLHGLGQLRGICVAARWADRYLKTVSETRGAAYNRKGSDTSRQPEVKHVPAYSHSDRWVGASRAWGGAWVGAGEIS